MCAIFGLEKKQFDILEMKEGFEKLTSRGPDGTRYIETDTSILGFKRLSIMGLTDAGMQPFTLDENACVCNGEVYGFRPIKEELSKKYQFKSESDCEILLPLYKEYGFKMFEMLDAEYALIIYDALLKKLIAARDPLGIRPLYYGYSKRTKGIAFASEPKALLDIVDKVFPFPPGYYYDGDKFVKYIDLTSVDTYIEDIDKATYEINKVLTKSIVKRLDSDAKIGFLLSGGLDSSLVCSIANKALKEPIKTFSIGMREDAIDLKYAKEVADYLKTDHTEVIITKDDVLEALDTVINILGTFDITTIRASIGMYLVCKYIHEKTDIRVILTGEVSDELFGYKYTDFAPDEIAFQNEAIKRINEIHIYDVLRADRCISANSLEARVPFGDKEFVKLAMSISPSLKMNHYNKGKYLLRKAFEGDYLPHDILYREKAAFSDAVGHSMVDYLKEYANNYYTDSEFEEKILKYTHARPYTKESLLYREIFEKYYPDQAHMIKGFWLPNQEWEGCKVSDPSARVLSNYLDSGK